MSYEIYNSLGQAITSGKLSEKTIVPTGSYSPGVYVVKIVNGRTVSYRRIVKGTLSY